MTSINIKPFINQQNNGWSTTLANQKLRDWALMLNWKSNGRVLCKFTVHITYTHVLYNWIKIKFISTVYI
jgi:hypothetical protein